MTVLEICHALHLSDTEQSAKLAPESRKVMSDFLQERMAEWGKHKICDCPQCCGDCDPRRLKFDRLVYQLCEAVLDLPQDSEDPEYNPTGIGF